MPIQDAEGKDNCWSNGAAVSFVRVEFGQWKADEMLKEFSFMVRKVVPVRGW